MKLLLDNLPPSLTAQRDVIAQCLAKMNEAMRLERVYLFGSHARGEARPDSDVDLCLVADGAEHQFKSAAKCRSKLWDIWPRPPFTLIPITPARLDEKRASGDYFFATVLKEGVLLATQN